MPITVLIITSNVILIYNGCAAFLGELRFHHSHHYNVCKKKKGVSFIYSSKRLKYDERIFQMTGINQSFLICHLNG